MTSTQLDTATNYHAALSNPNLINPGQNVLINHDGEEGEQPTVTTAYEQNVSWYTVIDGELYRFKKLERRKDDPDAFDLGIKVNGKWTNLDVVVPCDSDPTFIQVAKIGWGMLVGIGEKIAEDISGLVDAIGYIFDDPASFIADLVTQFSELVGQLAGGQWKEALRSQYPETMALLDALIDKPAISSVDKGRLIGRAAAELASEFSGGAARIVAVLGSATGLSKIAKKGVKISKKGDSPDAPQSPGPNAGNRKKSADDDKKCLPKTHKHHVFPKYLGGPEVLVEIDKQLHDELHGHLDAWKGGKYRRGLSAEHFKGVDKNLIVQELREFYSNAAGGRYAPLLKDFERAVAMIAGNSD